MTDSTDRREETLIKKYGSAETLREKRREWQAKSRKNYKGTGGFKALDTERVKEISNLGVIARKKNGVSRDN